MTRALVAFFFAIVSFSSAFAQERLATGDKLYYDVYAANNTNPVTFTKNRDQRVLNLTISSDGTREYRFDASNRHFSTKTANHMITVHRGTIRQEADRVYLFPKKEDVVVGNSWKQEGAITNEWCGLISFVIHTNVEQEVEQEILINGNKVTVKGFMIKTINNVKR